VSDELIYANGINGVTGEYLLGPLPPSAVGERARQGDDPEVADELKAASERLQLEAFGLPFNLHPEIVAEVGWAIVFSAEEDAAVKEALRPLVDLRREQVGALTKELVHNPGEDWRAWLDRHGVAPGNVDPEKVPYYLLLVGGPQRIPFEFQFLLDVEYAVGRLDFDGPDGYRGYVRAVRTHEAGAAPPREAAATFFGTRHEFDGATKLSADLLVGPLADALGPGGPLARAVPDRRVDRLLGEPATKAALSEVLAGARGRPGLLFSATHGMGGWPAGHRDQAAKHGALLCQDWPGVGRMSPSHYFAAADLGPQPDVAGMVAFFFACYGAGTPRFDAFSHAPGVQPPAIADAPFVALLPKALLAAGALAVIGHVERAWGYSFASGQDAQLGPFRNAIGRILLGQPVAYAMSDFNEKYAVLSAGISSVLERLGQGTAVPDAELARLWTERNDAQNYVVLGDPAVALRTA
jgi:hypothetical protein